MKIFLSPWMKELDELTIKKIGIPSIVLMENAARGAAHVIMDEFPLGDFANCLILLGKGNNGGDGLAAGRILGQQGYRVSFLTLFPTAQFQGDARVNLCINQRLHLPHTAIRNRAQLKKILAGHSPKDTFIIDAIFGTGISRPIKKGLLADVMSLVNGSGFAIAALDVPSGISESFLPDEGVHIRAAVTTTFGGLKWSLLHPDGNDACGKIRVIDIGIPSELAMEPKYYIDLIEPQEFSLLLQPRPSQSHKGDFGHVLSVAGSLEKPGAGVLSAFSALKSGAGLVTAAIPFANRRIYIRAHPELMTLPYSRPEELREKLRGFDCILAGPGLGTGAQTSALIEMILRSSRVPVVLDADGLNALAENPALLEAKRNHPLILTPHPGEFSRLTGLAKIDILRDRTGVGREFARRHGVHLILKGHHTLLATPSGQVHVNQTGNAGMAKAGAGDVLSGMIAGMVAQFHRKHTIEKILQAAVFLHGYAADLAVRKMGEMTMVATDIIAAIPQAIAKIHDFHGQFRIA